MNPDDVIVNDIQAAVNELNRLLKIASIAGIIINLDKYDITSMEYRVRCKMYSVTADKRIIGGLD